MTFNEGDILVNRSTRAYWRKRGDESRAPKVVVVLPEDGVIKYYHPKYRRFGYLTRPEGWIKVGEQMPVETLPAGAGGMGT